MSKSASPALPSFVFHLTVDCTNLKITPFMTDAVYGVVVVAKHKRDAIVLAQKANVEHEAGTTSDLWHDLSKITCINLGPCTTPPKNPIMCVDSQHDTG